LVFTGQTPGDLIIKEDLIVDSIIEALVKASISKCYVKPA